MRNVASAFGGAKDDFSLRGGMSRMIEGAKSFVAIQGNPYHMETLGLTSVANDGPSRGHVLGRPAAFNLAR